jgi:HEPN domain-containing protein
MKGERREEARRWFQQGMHDLKAARWNIEGGFFNTACFLSQQGAEKALKSLLYYIGSRKKALFTHSLVEMVIEGGRKVNDLTKLLDQARMLDLHYIPSRYPNGLPAGYPHLFYNAKVAEEAVRDARKIIQKINDFYLAQNETDILRED